MSGCWGRAHLLQLQLHGALGCHIPQHDLHVGVAGAGCGPLGPRRLDLLQGELHHQLLGAGGRQAYGWNSLTHLYPSPADLINRRQDTPLEYQLPSGLLCDLQQVIALPLWTSPVKLVHNANAYRCSVPGTLPSAWDPGVL